MVNDNFQGDLLVEMKCRLCGAATFHFDKFDDLVLDLESEKSGGPKKGEPTNNQYIVRDIFFNEVESARARELAFNGRLGHKKPGEFGARLF